MRIYLAGPTSKGHHKFLIRGGAKKLFSYLDLITPNRGYGEEDRFREWVERKRGRRK